MGNLGTPPYYDWQYIAHSDTSIWAAPIGVQHIYNQWKAAKGTSNQATFPFAIDPDAENFVLNIENSTNPPPNPVRPFAALTFITPCANESDHPLTSGADDGPEWLAYVINAIGKSPYWNSTAIIVTWDDWGGWYDSEPQNPPHPAFPNLYGVNPDPNEWGFRVPLMIISPYVQYPGYISSQATSGFQYRSQGVILQMIEHMFGLASLNGDDFQQGQNDYLSDAFNFSRALPYAPITTPNPFIPQNNGACP